MCTALALAVAIYSAHYAWRSFVPIAFVLVIVVLAVRYGMTVAVAGAAITALIFAYYMLPPHHSLRVADSGERASIAWMLLGALAISFLVAGPAETHHRK